MHKFGVLNEDHYPGRLQTWTLTDARPLCTSPNFVDSKLACADAVAPRVYEDGMADALKEAATKKLEGFSQDVKVRLVP